MRGGDVVALSGDLGAGKTAFAQGVGESLGVKGSMTSPTFTFQQEYIGRILNSGMGIETQTETEIRLIHMDLYRLQRPEEVEVIGVEDAFVEDAVCLIEWPEIAEDLLPESRLDIQIIGSGEAPREIIFRAREHDWELRLKDLNILGEVRRIQ
ncbi:TsaE protein, required for threonylcarbamoyladenosine t(6)A37 formation in tRNA [Desulfosporosinus sp. I2]|nr:TsaE protein, required for threonylcarbamoyladenosine t(6)A37 formation in tRNA [Desulfosporosinus sp. I2]